MAITAVQYEASKVGLQMERSRSVRRTQLESLSPLLRAIGKGCKRLGLEAPIENLHATYLRMNPWGKDGMIDRLFENLRAR